MPDKILTPEEFSKIIEKENNEKNLNEQLKTEKENSIEKYHNNGGKLKIKYESEGIFSIPSVAYFTDYTAKEINDLKLSTSEDLMENLVAVLQNKATDSEGKLISVKDMTLDEFFETLVGMKIQYKSQYYDYDWYCKCQESEESPEPKKLKIDLTKINYKSISQINENLQKKALDSFSSISDEDFKKFLQSKSLDENISKEDFVKTLIIKEPIVINNDGKKYYFRFPRVGDLIDAVRYVEKKYAGKLKRVKNEVVIKKQNDTDPNYEKDQKIKKLNKDKAKDVLLYLKAMGFLGIDGNFINDINEKVSVFSNLKQEIIDKLDDLMEEIQCGINEELNLVCEQCGKTTRRWLQQELDIFKLLPLKTDNTSRIGGIAFTDISFGA